MELCSNTKYNSNHSGKIISFRGSLVDEWFENKIPIIFNLLHASKDKEILFEVLVQLEPHSVRGIASKPTQELASGMITETDGKELTVYVGKFILGRMFDTFGNTFDQNEPPTNGHSKVSFHVFHFLNLVLP